MSSRLPVFPETVELITAFHANDVFSIQSRRLGYTRAVNCVHCHRGTATTLYDCNHTMDLQHHSLILICQETERRSYNRVKEITEGGTSSGEVGGGGV